MIPQFFFTDSVNSVNEVMKEVEIFGDNAGPKINWSKSKLMKLNIDVQNTDKLHFTEDSIKCIGVYVGKCYKEVENLNGEGKVGKIKKYFRFMENEKIDLLRKGD